MKYNIICLLLTLNAFVAFSQPNLIIDSTRITCTYLYEFLEDSTSDYSRKSETMTLQIGNYVSKFSSTNRLYTDSVIMANDNGVPTVEGFQKIQSLTSGTANHAYCRNYVYKNYPEKGSFTQTMYMNKSYFQVIEPLKFNWKIIPAKSEMIAGFLCQKAETNFAGRDYEAWFTTEIPISDGPYKFCGLPGLIVKISDKKNQHSYILATLQQDVKPTPIYLKNPKYVSISSTDFVKAIFSNNAETYKKFSMEENIKFNNDETKARTLNKLKSQNNYIEKYQ